MAASVRGKGKDEKAPKERGFLFTGNFWAHTLFRILVAALVVAGGWLALAMAHDKAVKLSDFQVSAENLEFVKKPEWLKGPIEQQLKNIGMEEKKISLLDGDATKRVAAWLSANAMVKNVKSIKREFPNRVRAQVELREPAAFVLRGGKYYIVDTEGIRLSGEYASKAEAGLELLHIAYVRSSPPVAGKTWGDPAVVEAAKLAGFLKGHEELVKEARITAIDSSNIGGRRNSRESEIVLVTAGHTKICWGRGLDSGNATELPAEQKIEALRKVMDQVGGVGSLEYVDVRFASPGPVYREKSYHIGGV